MAVGKACRAEERDQGERLSADDQATQREAEFLDRALKIQSMRAAATPRGTPGVCMNCRARCLPLAVYCDEDCRGDHEHRQGLPR